MRGKISGLLRGNFENMMIFAALQNAERPFGD